MEKIKLVPRLYRVIPLTTDRYKISDFNRAFANACNLKVFSDRYEYYPFKIYE